MKPSFTKEEFVEAVKSSKTIAEILRKLCLAVRPGNYTTIHKYIKKWEIDFSHWEPQKISTEKLVQFRINNRIDTQNLLVENSEYSRTNLKKRLVKEGFLKYCCCKCGLTSWQGEDISLQLDHINGINDDNRIENLRLLCPNCHSQTTNFNRKGGKVAKKCLGCGKTIRQKFERCISCSNKHKVGKFLNNNTRISWPPDEDLLKMVEQRPFTVVAKELGVSDNAIRKRLKVRFGYYPKHRWGFKK